MSIAIKNFYPSDSSDQHPGHQVPPSDSQVILPKTAFSTAGLHLDHPVVCLFVFAMRKWPRTQENGCCVPVIKAI